MRGGRGFLLAALWGARGLVGLWGLGLGVGIALGQPVALEFYAEGPGAVVVACPPPYMVGQGLSLTARPSANARFVAWEDGDTAIERLVVVREGAATFKALFEDLHAVPYLEGLKWKDFVAAGRSHVTYASFSQRVPFLLSLRARQSIQVFRASDLESNHFLQAPFAVSPSGAMSSQPRMIEAGLARIWVDAPADSVRYYYKIRLDGTRTYPSLYLAQALQAPPGGEVILYGEGLSGVVTAEAGGVRLAAAGVSETMVRVTMPMVPGSYWVKVTVDGAEALGAISISVQPEDPMAPWLTAVNALPTGSGGWMEVVGRNLDSRTEFFVDGKQVDAVTGGGAGTNAYLAIPSGIGGSHQVTAVRDGAISGVLGTRSDSRSSVLVPGTTKGVRLFAWNPEGRGAFFWSPATQCGLRVYAWDSRPLNTYSLVPATLTGVRVYAP